MKKGEKLRMLLNYYPQGVPLLTHGFAPKRISTQLFYAYKKNKWLYSLGHGAYMQKGKNPTLYGAVHALQKQAAAPVHIGGLWALYLLGFISENQRWELFASAKYIWPKWFCKRDWRHQLGLYETDFLPQNMGVQQLRINGLRIKISNPIRALLECLYLAHSHEDILRVFDILFSIQKLSPMRCQKLLERCNSKRVKRLFLSMALYSEHSYFLEIDQSNIDLGTAKYSKGAAEPQAYCKKYKICLPIEIVYRDVFD